MIETAYVKNEWLYARVNGHEKPICSFSGSDRLEGFTGAGVTYVKGGWRHLWAPSGQDKIINHV